MGLIIEENVNRLIDERGITPYRLSKMSGVSLSAIYGIKDKKQGPTAETLLKIADALGVTVDEIVREKRD
ncbi:helix-turn-helix domain-containing protein [Cohnella nanjingensis]|uniref:Helix-turn-helix transcriptional regulator n=1 Tax=Cohnella nanjingensis TaxID=1387779 RepID=A0A7X0RMG3_9BACL|nr:helix-turn-helix transcriptional regulator [Cohnella nanjingensis]MBB6670242.1 helix-turn-helix transcriptional regulator [Cohnella nanjingensis]